MSMEITNNYNHYAASSTNVAKNVGTTKESNVITSVVELKTSTPGVTKKEEIKTGYKNVNDYSKYLQGKYSYMNIGTTSMEGVPTTVSVSGAFLEKCMNDPEKAKYLEENLAAIPDCAAYAVSHSLGTLTSLTYKFDADGNITIISSGTNDPDGKIARENAKRKAQEKKTAEEKASKKRAEKKAEEEKTAKKRAEQKATEEAGTELGTYTVSATGTDIKTVTQRVVTASIDTSASTGVSFDIRA
ncbi:MAG: cell envelope integrity protein TolA [Clostridium sp.]|nr:cell envelope integrity protein TolA [Clostridium sp.]MCM1459182.1 cell envelope integrity protein TolA [Bacteroides sp.]